MAKGPIMRGLWLSLVGVLGCAQFIIMAASPAVAAERMVLAESFTATWCSACPRTGRALDKLMDNYPDDFVSIQYHLSDAYQVPFAIERDGFYSVGLLPTTWFDGDLGYTGALADDDLQYAQYYGAMQNRLGVATDVTLDLDLAEVGEQTYEVTCTVGIEADGQAKAMAVYIARVLDYYPTTTDDHYRNCVRECVKFQLVTLSPGETTPVTGQFTVTGTDWTNKENVKLVAWACEQGTPGPKEIHQANWTYLFNTPAGDLNGDGVIDLVDLATMLSVYLTCSGDDGYRADADFDEDGCIYLSDLATLLGNYGYGL